MPIFLSKLISGGADIKAFSGSFLFVKSLLLREQVYASRMEEGLSLFHE